MGLRNSSEDTHRFTRSEPVPQNPGAGERRDQVPATMPLS